jgi:hypothetical protein
MYRKMRQIFRFFFLLVTLCFSAAVLCHAESAVKVKILAVNPSDTQSIKAVIAQPLPSEIDPTQDVIDKAGLEIRFNPDNKVYMLSGEVELKPRETKSFEVMIRDVWQVSPDQIEETKKNLESQITALKGTKYYDTAKLLYEKAQLGIDRILEEQGRPVGMKQHVELYRAHVQQLLDIKSNALSMGAMRQLEEEKKKGVAEARFLIMAENPSAEAKTMTVRSALPKELTSEDVLDKQDFILLFEQQQKTYVLQKEDQFAPKETKKYIITIRDIWRIPEEEIDFNRKQTEQLVQLFQETPFEKFAEDQASVILDILSGISKLQAELDSSLALEDRMRAFVLNTQQMNVAKAKLRDLQQLVSEVPLKKDDSQILEKIKYFVKKLADTKDVVLMAMGIKPDSPIVWWIIFGIIAFLGLISTVFYVIWLKKLQENKWAAKGKGKTPQGESLPPSQAGTSADKEKK